PLTIHHFHRVTPGALPANLLAGPLMAAAFVGAIALECVAPLPAPLAHALAWAVQRLVDGSFLSAELVRSIPAMSWRRPTPAAAIEAAYVASLLLLLLVRSRNPSKRPGCTRAAAAAVCLSGALLVAPWDTAGAPDGLRLTVLDVGQGDCALIET